MADPGHLCQHGFRGKVTKKGTPAGQKNWSEETRGQWGWEGWGAGLRTGRRRGLSESGVTGADLRGREGEAGGGGANKSTSWEGILCGAGGAEGSVRSVKGLKLERGVKGSV